MIEGKSSDHVAVKNFRVLVRVGTICKDFGWGCKAE